MRNAPSYYDVLPFVKMLTMEDGVAYRRTLDGNVPVRPMGYFSLRNRLRAAKEAFLGRADLIYWPYESN